MSVPLVSIEDRMYQALAEEWGGNSHAPGDHLSVVLRERAGRREPYVVAETRDDGGVLWIGYSDQWWGSLTPHEARDLAWFILWRWWARGTWFGVRRRLWFWLLRRAIRRHWRNRPHQAARFDHSRDGEEGAA